MAMRWMIYGANGYTGRLIVEEAVKRGHTPILAGRSLDKIVPLAREFSLEYVVFHLDDVNIIAEAVADVDLVFHAAGPYIYTSDPMIRACIATKTHYLDITGEIDVFENTFRYDEVARKNGVLVMSGVGFDIVPTDCMAKYVADKLPKANKLTIGVWAITRASSGTTKSIFEMIPRGGRIRQNGDLKSVPFGKQSTIIPMLNGDKIGLEIPWGDIATAYRTTGIPNIRTYMVVYPQIAQVAYYGGSVVQSLLKVELLRKSFGKIVEKIIDGPNEKFRQVAQSYIWVHVGDADGNQVEAWLQTVEAYEFTAKMAVLAVERVAELRPVGALTPAIVFGKDFVLEVKGTKRFDERPKISVMAE